MINVGIKNLEIDKILKKLSKKAICQETKEKLLNLEFNNDFEKSNILLNQTKSAFNLMIRFGDLPIKNMENITKSVKKAKLGATLSLKEFLEIKEVLISAKAVSIFGSKFSNDNILKEKFSLIVSNRFLFEKINSSIISETSIADTATKELYSIRKKIKKSENKVREILEEIIKSPKYQKYLQEAIITIKNSKLALPVKSEYKTKIDGLVHDFSSSGSTLFIEPRQVLIINNEISLFKTHEKKEIEKFLSALSLEVSKVSESLILSYDSLIKLDIIFAKARLAKAMNAIVPKINNNGKIVLKKAKHPLIEVKKAIPVDIYLGDKFNILIISGPNTGGKTVSIKIVGIFALMVKLGLMIPANEESEICIFDRILVDIGDEQSIEQSLSTFSGHILKLAKIIKFANEKSLILIDEIGSGTDPEQGAAIATSIIESLKEKKSKILLTTHYPSLKEYAFLNQEAENACLEFDEKTLMPTYKLIIGSAGRSNAFEIAKRLGIGEEIIKRARKILPNKSLQLDNILKTLEIRKKEIENLKVKTENLQKDALILKEKTKKEYEKIQKESEKILKKDKQKAKEILEKVKREAKEFLLEFKKIKNSEFCNKNKAELKKNIKNLDKLKYNLLEDERQQKHKIPKLLNSGDRVLITDINQEANVLNFSGKDKLVEVLVKNNRVFVDISKLKFLKKSNSLKNSSTKITTPIKIDKIKNIAREVDLRGLYALEAIDKLDKFIYEALMSKIKEIKIIHGKGTGVLMQKVNEHLKNHQNIENYRKGGFSEGGIGATIAILK